jgi:acetyl/propionyl-CoA carboxylase alpha subunit
MDRALREFRIRGVTTNIPFVENVVNHPRFRAGEITTSFLDDSRTVPVFAARAIAPPDCFVSGRCDPQRQSRVKGKRLRGV